MCAASADRPFFLPAETTSEAIARIYSLTGASDAGTRGEKRAIVALRDALGLDLDMARTNALMGQHIAAALGVEWRSSYADLNKVNLDGLNALLEGATEAYHLGSLRRLIGKKPPGLDGPQWSGFEPAQSKIEAVNRISSLTHSGPEWLGPGSKEHKSVLINLAVNLAPHIDPRLSKTKLGAALAAEFGAPWSDACESTGETISLIGLNTLLAGAELRLGRLGQARKGLFGTPQEEGMALAGALLDGWRAERQADGGKRVVWDARHCIQWMKEQGVSEGPNQNEWQGFYWESRGRTLLNSAFTPNPNPPKIAYGNTSFDYSLRFVWDLKAHTESWRSPSTGAVKRGQSAAPLNDQEAMEACVREQGLGFLMVGGEAIVDEDRSFYDWHAAFKAAGGVKSRSSNSGNSRARKSAFEPLHVEAFWFDNSEALEAAKAAGQITGFAQGKQAPDEEGGVGRIRRPKYNLSVPKARQSSINVARLDWPRS
ncbi:hypothetical protein [Nocardioides jiangxiensis]|uniref:Uncharacterized protein n=1 Tax=Nocardioides jiangxiensis TaxID=3064524 RepID=A0ABT9B008_9ACTN|nr:hypothetical protein [Nocardioides sp. WY-20]MDO7868175.1 hypothetical protein [Nocardioides sp. WY-20]